jgi:hypothetical protein
VSGPRPPGAQQAAPLLLALALVALLLALALANPAPQTIDVGAPGDAYFLANFYPAEAEGATTYRWGGPGASLRIPSVAQGPLALTLRLHGAPFAPPADLRLSLARAGWPAAAFATTPAWRVYRLLLPPSPGGPAGQAALDLDAPPATPGPADLRPLGIALDYVDLKPFGPQPAGPPLARALALTWALGLLAAAAPLRRRYGAAAVLMAGAGLALWAWRDPGGFAWALPTPPLWALALGSGLGIWGWVRPLGRPLPQMLDSYGRLARTMLGPYGAPTLLAGGHLGLLLPLPWRGLAALLLLGAPGWLAARALFPDEDDPPARLLLGLCGALAVAPMLMLALHALPGPPPAWLLLLCVDLLSAAMLGLIWRADRRALSQGAGAAGRPPAPGISAAWLLLLVGLALRLTLLGGAEFQGDEARAMLLAAGVAQGADGILLTHTKGPVEALLPAGPLILAGAGAEWLARLPFALAGAGLLLAAVAMARAMAPAPEGRGAGVAAAVAVGLLSTDGFALGFARIVQYQSVVLLMSAGAIWCGWRFYAGAARPQRYLLAAAALLAVGLLAHYDAALAAPALAWLGIAGARRRGWGWREWLAGLGAPALLGAAMLASFFLPYLAGPSFSSTAAYLAGRAGQGDSGGPPFNNLPLYLSILAFYNAPPLVPILAGLLLAALCLPLLARARPQPLGWLAAGALLAAGLALALRPQLFAMPGGASWAGLALGLPLAALCLLPGVPAGQRALAIWLAAPLCAEAFLIAEPRTHFYGAHPPAALLIGWAGAWLWARLAHVRRARPALAAAAALWLAASLGYAQLLYLRQFPEYQRSFPAARPSLLLASYGDQLPEAGYFGFPHNDGWKAAAELYRAGVIRGSYDTNQNHWLAGWYMRAAPRCAQRPSYYLIAEAEASRYFPPGYSLAAEITVGPARALAIYSRAPHPGPPTIYRSEDLAAAFDARPLEPFPAAAILADGPRPECGG